jgi:DNA-binding CsgD family transcriptional regulator
VQEPLGDLHAIAMSFDLLSACLVAAGELERAAVLHGAAGALWTLLNAPVLLGPGYAEFRAAAAGTARAGLGAERFAALRGHGSGLPLSAALAVARGETPAAPPSGSRGGPPDGTRTTRLTPREREVAALVAEGLANRDIAGRLYLSKRTVDSHVEHIFGKLGLSSRTELAAWVLERRG